ncbi:MAG: hypothetical protein KME30_22590 [Iphinoe sp. HA4291-MV1]|jgi:hypothetical protein|nr:hypothetical protein [Iphinoe sp. HA4291-MV1]
MGNGHPSGEFKIQNSKLRIQYPVPNGQWALSPCPIIPLALLQFAQREIERILNCFVFLSIPLPTGFDHTQAKLAEFSK